MFHKTGPIFFGIASLLGTQAYASGFTELPGKPGYIYACALAGTTCPAKSQPTTYGAALCKGSLHQVVCKIAIKETSTVVAKADQVQPVPVTKPWDAPLKYIDPATGKMTSAPPASLGSSPSNAGSATTGSAAQVGGTSSNLTANTSEPGQVAQIGSGNQEAGNPNSLNGNGAPPQNNRGTTSSQPQSNFAQNGSGSNSGNLNPGTPTQAGTPSIPNQSLNTNLPPAMQEAANRQGKVAEVPENSLANKPIPYLDPVTGQKTNLPPNMQEAANRQGKVAEVPEQSVANKPISYLDSKTGEATSLPPSMQEAANRQGKVEQVPEESVANKPLQYLDEKTGKLTDLPPNMQEAANRRGKVEEVPVGPSVSQQPIPTLPDSNSNRPNSQPPGPTSEEIKQQQQLQESNLAKAQGEHADDLADGAKRAHYDAKGNAKSNDPCSVSADINDRYRCSGTKTVMETSKVMNVMTQSAGALATQFQGQQDILKAQNEGTQAAVMESAARTQMKAADMQMKTAGVNAAFGAVQMYMGFKHGRSATGVRADANKQGSVLYNGIESAANEEFSRAEKAAKEADRTMTAANRMSNPNAPEVTENSARIQAQKKQWIDKEAKKAGVLAASEQEGMKQEAMSAAGATIMSSMQMAAAAQAGKINAKGMLEAAAKLKDATNSANNIKPPGFDPFASGDNNPFTGTNIGGDGTNPNEVAATDGSPNTDPNKSDNPFGNPIADAPPNTLSNVPAAGKFGTGGPGGSAQGGTPLSVGGGGGTSPSTEAASAGEGQAKMADARGGGGYSSGGGAPMGAGGSPDKGPDLSGLLAQFLPKQDDAGNKNGILEFGANGRSPASADSGSFLDKNANLFQRIHDTYQEKHKRGVVGI